MPSISDIQLVKLYQNSSNPEHKKIALHKMWDRYSRLRFKMKGQLRTCCKNNGIRMNELIEEYDSRAWEKLIQAMDSIRPKDCAHITDWKLYLQLWGYWRSMNRDIIHEWMNTAKNNCEISFYGKDSDEESGVSNIDKEIALTGINSTERLFENKMNKKVFWVSMNLLKKRLNNRQLALIGLTQRGISKKNICKKLNIPPESYDNNLLIIKNDFQLLLKKVSNHYDYEVNYEEYL